MESIQISKSSIIATNIEKWQQNLLDLSKRNALVNFKYNKKRVLKINNDIYELYEELLSNERIRNIEDLELDYDLDNPLESKEFLALVKKLRKERNSIMNEKGINVLYLVLGIIEWREHDNANEKENAPLLLLPVELYQLNRTSPMELRLFEDQLVVNPSLQFKMKSEFGVDFPDYEATDNLADYMDRVLNNIERLSGGQLLESAFLSLLSFSKIALYKDMESYKDLIEQHQIVGNIASSQKVYEREILEDIDRISPNESATQSFQVLDADSSQMEAIIAAKNGYSFVLQGPPGTGKSQTISNIISECIAKGQKVLFVSEKIAALNVVYKRLSQVGLGDYCLELHSNKANKKNVVSNLYDTYISNGRKRRPDEELFNKVDMLKNATNNYVAALHKVFEKYNKSAYDMHGYLASVSDIPTVNFDISDKSIKEYLYSITNLLDQLTDAHNGISMYKQSIWQDLKFNHWTIAQETELKEQLSQYIKILQQSIQFANNLQQQYHVSIVNLKQVQGVLKVHQETVGELDLLEHGWLTVNQFEQQLELIDAYHQDFLDYKQLEEELLVHYSEFVFPDILDVSEQLNSVDEQIILPSFYDQFIKGNATSLLRATDELKGILFGAASINRLEPIFKEPFIDSFTTLQQAQVFLALFNTGAKLPKDWVDNAEIFEEVLLHIPRDKENADYFKQQQAKLNASLHIEKIDEAVLSSAKSLNNINLNLEEIYQYCYGNRVDIVGMMTKCILDLDTAITIFDTLRSKLAINREANMANVTNLLTIIDILPTIRYYQKDWLEGVGLKTVERTNNEFLDLKEKIEQSKKTILEHWQLEIIELFEDDSELYNRFVNKYDSLLSKLGGKYRKDIKKVTKLLLDQGKVSYEIILSKLKYVDQYLKLMATYRDKERNYLECMGDLYDGLNTDVADIQKNIQMLKQFKDQSEIYGLTTTHMSQLLMNKNWFVTEFYDRGFEIKTALASLNKTFPILHVQLKENTDFETKTFDVLKETLNKKLPLVKVLVQQIMAIENVLLNKQLMYSEFKTHVADILHYHESLTQLTGQFSIYQHRYGFLFEAMATDWEEMQRLIFWWKDVKLFIKSHQFEQANIEAIRIFVKAYDRETVKNLYQLITWDVQTYVQLLAEVQCYFSVPFLEMLKDKNYVELQSKLAVLVEKMEVLYCALKELEGKRKISWTTVEEIVADMMKISAFQHINQQMLQNANAVDTLLKTNVTLSYEGFEQVKHQLQVNQRFAQGLESYDLTYNANLLACITQLTKLQLEELSEIIEGYEHVEHCMATIFTRFDADIAQSFVKHMNLIEEMYQSTHEIEMIVRIKALFTQLTDLGLGTMIDKVLANEELWTVDLKKLFLKRYYEVGLDEIYSLMPELKNFNKDNYERIINTFKVLDEKQFEENSKRMNYMRNEQLKEKFKEIEMVSQISILSRENEKKKRHLPLRQLFGKIPDLFLSLKPCVLMSPLSVCEFLNPRIMQFDLVVFDEASQICPEDAIAPMIRGRNVIMAGDSKQMPPTSFFKATASVDDEFDDEELVEEELYESVLGLCSDLMPQKTLKWHYRSKHESLIAFSNRHFYNNSLYTFPSVDNYSQDLGISFEYVENGYYDRSGSRTNLIEAERVADLVVELYEKNPNASLGVIAFSQTQMEAIEKVLEMKLKSKPQLEKVILNDSVEEPFFIKNLENVQGDERDIIILSVGYAKDQNGVLYHLFGPLNKAGGERRLNVAITRAKSKLILVSSMKDSEINLSRSQSTGVKLLKNYLEYARTGQIPESVLFNSELEFDSPLEQDIYESIVSLGYEVKTQVGTSGYRIDLAVIDPNRPGRFLVGIECDGATYHSSKTARDRDRLRQQVLEGLGWKIYRIWSQDWFKNKSREIQKVKAMLEYETSKQSTLNSNR